MAKRLIPCFNRILIEKIVPPSKTSAGILLPEKTSQVLKIPPLFLALFEILFVCFSVYHKIVSINLSVKGSLCVWLLKQLNSGKVIAVGPGSRDKAGNLIPVSVKEGDHVLLPEYGGTQIKLDDKEYNFEIVFFGCVLLVERSLDLLLGFFFFFAGSICLGMRTFWVFCMIDVVNVMRPTTCKL